MQNIRTFDFMPITWSVAYWISVTTIFNYLQIQLILYFFFKRISWTNFKKEEISFAVAFSGMGPCSQRACHTNPDQIHCQLTSFSVEELNVHHSATGIHYWAVRTLNATACYAAFDGNYFCHMEAKQAASRWRMCRLGVGGCTKCHRLYFSFLQLRCGCSKQCLTDI